MGIQRQIEEKNHGGTLILLIVNLTCLGYVLAILMKLPQQMKNLGELRDPNIRWMRSEILFTSVVLRIWGFQVLNLLGAINKKEVIESI